MPGFAEDLIFEEATGLSPAQWIALQGLILGHAYMSAGERGSPETRELFEHGLVESWSTGPGFLAWRLTEKGRQVIETTKKKVGMPRDEPSS